MEASKSEIFADQLQQVASLRLELAACENRLRGDGAAFKQLSRFYEARLMESTTRSAVAQSQLLSCRMSELVQIQEEEMLRIQVEAGRGLRALRELFDTLKEEILARQPATVHNSPPPPGLNPAHWLKQLT
eukprot:TRINITY_DN18886_c0_g1_i1.p1 TRINITY_DN18886_c0_g1~~TRINITY_DN18886_c0_g1_i1.p1  ORF type:complete len:131 (+),score=23.03 TRINITY_DN18886_c0_g1_i1:72-464(+)